MEQFEVPPEQRMSDAEAQEVLRLLAERQREREELRGQPTVQDVAALANAPVTEVSEALSEVRARNMVSVPVTQHASRSRMVLAFGASALVLLMVALLFVLGGTRGIVVATPMPPQLDPPVATPVAPGTPVAPANEVTYRDW
ncbi:MAG: hypothetical protein ACAH95_11040 [Fimbriimonas sp.]